MPLIAAAACPHPPLLVASVEGSAPVGLIVREGGSVRRTNKAPGYAHEAAQRFDDAVTGAYVAADPATLRNLTGGVHHPVIAIVGPTAAGKSALSLALADALGGEVVNADSMQLYRGMDIGTAKLPPEDRHGVPHHLLDIWDVTEPASVAIYQQLARAAVDDIRARGRRPILVGGSGLYLRAVLERFEFPGTDPQMRADLERRLAEHGPAVLHAELADRDPAAAMRILPSNGRRIVRALEVIALTGAPFTATLPEPTPAYESVQIGVDLDPPALDARVDARVDAMWAAGLIDEVRHLAAHGLRDGRTAARALGYQQMLAHIDGEVSLDQAAVDTAQATRRFVRRQRKWFRRDPRITWLDGTAPHLVPAALALVDRGK